MELEIEAKKIIIDPKGNFRMNLKDIFNFIPLDMTHKKCGGKVVAKIMDCMKQIETNPKGCIVFSCRECEMEKIIPSSDQNIVNILHAITTIGEVTMSSEEICFSCK